MTTTISTESMLHEKAAAISAIGRWSAANENLPWAPAPDSHAMHWSYDELRPLAIAAADMVKGDRAALRVLTLANPGHAREAAVGYLYSGLQIINRGEGMTPHRHAPTALRYMHEGDGAWTAVGGTKMYLEPRDVVITPAGQWHEHGNDSPTDSPAIWQDCTNDPLVAALAATQFELHTDNTHLEPHIFEQDRHHRNPNEPLLYKWDNVLRALDEQQRIHEPDPHHAYRHTLHAKGTHDPVTPVIDAAFTLLPAGTRTQPTRRTASAVLIGAQGRATVHVDGKPFRCNEGDSLAVPSWSSVSYVNDTDTPAVLFEFNDAPTMTALGLYREEKDAQR
ncbi:cupin domain-containing protein [Rhodococcus sp. BS-15]|uniref:cupin domain-containing protein n=1 Tax=Rhodococcus sp. BS-15 TaxID=1304954 RepID=UPI000B0362B0|nr:cupin domain-containing protein [Rhodococcus sp. BS-15]